MTCSVAATDRLDSVMRGCLVHMQVDSTGTKVSYIEGLLRVMLMRYAH